MTETTREERQRVIKEVSELPQELRIAYAMDRDADRLAKLEDGLRALAQDCEIRGENGKEAQFKDDPTVEESVRRAANKRLAGKLRDLLDD